MYRIILVALFLLHSAVSFSQDLVITSVEGEKVLDRYESIDVTITITNIGLINVTNISYARLYLSTDDVLSSDDKECNFLKVPYVGSMQSFSQKFSLGQIDVSPGNYFLIIKVDAFNSIVETDETNNIVVVPDYMIQSPNVDIRFNALSFKSSVAVNDRLSISHEVQNHGSTDITGSMYTAFYLSSDNVLDSEDRKLGIFYGTFGSSDIITETDLVSIPKVPPGVYYIIGRADHNHSNQSAYEETNENNNLKAVPITIKISDIDLDVTTAIPIAYMRTGDPGFNVRYTIANNGTTGVIGHSIDLYLSTDNVLDSFDYKIRSPYLHTEYVGSKQKITRTINLISYNDHEISGGEYYVFIHINSDSAITETSYSNNIARCSGTITTPLNTAIHYQTVNFLEKYNTTDTTLSMEVGFINYGPNCSVKEDYSVDILDSDFKVIHTEYFTESFRLYSGESTNRVWTLNLNSPLRAGLYRARLIALYNRNALDQRFVISEIDTLVSTIKGEDNVLLTKGHLSVYKKREDGTIRLVQKINPTSKSQYEFYLGNEEYTMYFIPDPIEFPDYLPTVFGKTTTTVPSSFFLITENTSLDFEILKIQPYETGSKVITGMITTTDDYQNLPLILLTESGIPIRITYPDETGKYLFNDLPDGKYMILVSIEPDHLQMEPILVDLSKVNANVDLQVSPESINWNIEEVLLSQTITFEALPEVEFGVEPFELVASSNSTLEIFFSSSNNEIAEIIDGKLVVHDVGTIVVTASQDGNDFYLPASSVANILQVNKAQQQITFETPEDSEFGANPIAFEAKSSSGLRVEFSSSDTDVISIVDGKGIIHNAGIVTITATQAGDNRHNAAQSISHSLTINRAAQEIFFEPFEKVELEEGNQQIIPVISVSSQLPITLTSSQTEVAEIIEGKVNVIGEGTTTITALQPGNNNYEAASSVSRVLIVTLITALEDPLLSLELFPNPSSDFVYFNQSMEQSKVLLSDSNGRTEPMLIKDNFLDLRNFASGVYFLVVQKGNTHKTFRIVLK